MAGSLRCIFEKSCFCRSSILCLFLSFCLHVEVASKDGFWVEWFR